MEVQMSNTPTKYPDPQVNDRYGRLVIVEVLPKIAVGIRNTTTTYLCHCDCGKDVVVTRRHITGAHTRSCGCLRKEAISACNYKHGGSDTPLYRVWTNSGWKNTTTFEDFYNWTCANNYVSGMRILRKDTTQPFSIANAYITDVSGMNSNKKNTILLTLEGTTQSLAAWGRDSRCIVSEQLLTKRIKSGMPLYEAMTTPVSPNKSYAGTGVLSLNFSGEGYATRAETLAYLHIGRNRLWRLQKCGILQSVNRGYLWDDVIAVLPTVHNRLDFKVLSGSQKGEEN